MTVADLHPEDLFDKLLLGELSPSDAQRLRQHLSTCRVCRFEHAARGDFQAEGIEVSALPPSLALRPLPPTSSLTERAAVTSPRRRRSRALTWGLAAAALISASGALASAAQGKAPWRVLGSLFSEVKRGETPTLGPSPKRKVISAGAAKAQASSAPPAAEPSSPPPPASATEAQLESRHAARHPAPKLDRAAALSVVTPPVEVVKEPLEKRPASAAQLFGDANQARRAGDIHRASALYHLLQDQYPSSPEAELSRVTASLLLLDSGDARAALAGFERYLSGSSRGLEAEAMVGRARALGRLGRRDLEASAWRDVQRKYPATIYGRQATERLSALGKP